MRIYCLTNSLFIDKKRFISIPFSNRNIINLFKKSYSILFFISLFTIISCEPSKDKPKRLSISNPNISVNFRDSVIIDAKSDYEISYIAHDPYIISLNGSKITGQHVGSTTVSVLSNGDSEDINVNVLSVSSLFEYPIQDYSNGKKYYRDKYQGFNKKYEDDTTLVFFILSYDEKEAYYLQLNFTNDNTTENAILTFLIGISYKVFDALNERFEVWDNTDSSFLFINALHLSEATEYSIMEFDKKNQLCYAFITQIDTSNISVKKKSQIINLQNKISPKTKKLLQNKH